MQIMQKGLIVHTIISNDQGEILILQRSKKNDVLPEYWDVPGGTLGDGENPEVGAIREVKEESGIDITNLKLFFQKSNIDTSKNMQFVTLVFHAKTSKVEVILNPEEHGASVWIKPADIGIYKVVDYLPDCLRAYKELNIN